MLQRTEDTIALFQEKQRLKREAFQDPEVLESLRIEFEFRNKARRILAEQGGETNPEVLAEIEATITLEEMQEKAATLAA
jgi:hypothetical protein